MKYPSIPAVAFALFAAPPPADTRRQLSLEGVADKPNVVRLVSFVLNSLSREPVIKKAKRDGGDVVFDLADYGIPAKAFDAMPWPKGARSAEWFVANAMSPPHYYQLLGVDSIEQFRKKVGLDEKVSDKLGLSRTFLRLGSEVAARPAEIVTRHSTVCGAAWEFATPHRDKWKAGIHHLDGSMEMRLFVAHLPNELAASAIVNRDDKLQGYADDKVAYDRATPIRNRRFAVARSCVLMHRGFENFGDDKAESKYSIGVVYRDQKFAAEANRALRCRYGVDVTPYRVRDQRLYEKAVFAAAGWTASEASKQYAALLERCESMIVED